MLTTLKAYSPWPTAPTLLLDDAGRPETDLLQIRNIEGLDPVKAAINTAALGSVDGTAFIGAVLNTARNIVLTIHPNPDYDEWTYDTLRNLIYAYFAPKKPLALVFHSDDILPVVISGYTEDVTLNPFSKDPEYQVSVICPDPYFTSLEPIVVEGDMNDVGLDGAPYPVLDYHGSMEVGINVEVEGLVAASDAQITIALNDEFGLRVSPVVVNSHRLFAAGSVPGNKYVQNINKDTGAITSLLSNLTYGSTWPVLIPGPNELRFNLYSTALGLFDGTYKLTYSERYIGL